jgi:single-strand DNA-binding protein
MYLNKAFILGNLTNDPDLRQTPQGQSVCSFSVATNSFFVDRDGNKQKRTEFHNVVVWGKQAEIAAQFLKKGSSVLIEGRIQTRTWQDRQGMQRKTTEIVAERMQLGPRKAVGESILEEDKNEPSEVMEITSEIKDELPEINLEESEINLDDIPF